MRRALLVCGLAALAAASLAQASFSAVQPISDARQIKADGTPVNIGAFMTVSGVVTAAGGTFSTTDLDIYIQDATGGLNIVKRNAGYFNVKLGDSIVVTGQVDQGGTQPTRGNNKLTVANLSDIIVVGKGTLPRPLTVTAADLARESEPPLEAYEGRLVRIEGVTFNPADWPAAGTDKTITAQDGMGSLKLRLDRDTDIDGSAVPAMPFIIIGIVVQDDASLPWLSGYTVWPRGRQTDFLVMGPGCGLAQAEPAVVDEGTAAFDLAVTLAGNQADTIRAFSIDLPLADGWGWERGIGLSGPGLRDATYELTATGVTVTGAAIFDDLGSYGVVTFTAVSAPATPVKSYLAVLTSVDGVTFGGITTQPALASVLPQPSVVINEVFPDDGAAGSSDAFIEIWNQGASTARLEGFVVAETRAVPYCDTEARYTFTAADTIPAGGYLVLAESAEGFAARFGAVPAIQAAMSPLGRVSGDGGICGDGETYEAISLWRDAAFSDLFDYVEYRDGSACETDLCDLYGTASDALPVIPPRGYGIVSRQWQVGRPYEALSADPSPGAANRTLYIAPTVESVASYSQSVVEIFFSEAVDPAEVGASNFSRNGSQAEAFALALSGEKALLSFPDAAPGSPATVEVSGLRSLAGIAGRDTVSNLTVALGISTRSCAVQSSDVNGYSPFNGQGVTMFGFITVPPQVFQPDYQSIYVQGLDGCGANVFSYEVSSPRPRIGDFVSVAGGVTEYISAKAGSTTEISMAGPTNLTIYSRGYPEPVALVLSTGATGREEYEGRLVQTEGAVVSASDYSFYIDDGSGGIQVYQNYTPIDFTRFHAGMYVRVKGVILQYDFTMPFLEGYELVPRYDSDIEIIQDAFPGEASLRVEARVFCPSCGEDAFSIRFGAPSASDVTVRIFDAAGRSISTIYNGASTGEREFLWTGRDGDGKALPPGLYVCHVKAVEAVTGKLTTETAPIVIGTQLK
jgi:hypothetical protein